MKKLFTTFSICLLVCMSIFLVGCGGGDDDKNTGGGGGSNPTPVVVLGTYSLSSTFKLNGAEVTAPEWPESFMGSTWDNWVAQMADSLSAQGIDSKYHDEFCNDIYWMRNARFQLLDESRLRISLVIGSMGSQLLTVESEIVTYEIDGDGNLGFDLPTFDTPWGMGFVNTEPWVFSDIKTVTRSYKLDGDSIALTVNAEYKDNTHHVIEFRFDK